MQMLALWELDHIHRLVWYGPAQLPGWNSHGHCQAGLRTEPGTSTNLATVSSYTVNPDNTQCSWEALHFMAE